jgi:hypothetical protein
MFSLESPLFLLAAARAEAAHLTPVLECSNLVGIPDSLHSTHVSEDNESILDIRLSIISICFIFSLFFLSQLQNLLFEFSVKFHLLLCNIFLRRLSILDQLQVFDVVVSQSSELNIMAHLSNPALSKADVSNFILLRSRFK